MQNFIFVYLYLCNYIYSCIYIFILCIRFDIFSGELCSAKVKKNDTMLLICWNSKLHITPKIKSYDDKMHWALLRRMTLSRRVIAAILLV